MNLLFERVLLCDKNFLYVRKLAFLLRRNRDLLVKPGMRVYLPMIWGLEDIRADVERSKSYKPDRSIFSNI